jgi:hypothetical protein
MAAFSLICSIFGLLHSRRAGKALRSPDQEQELLPESLLGDPGER